MKFLRVYQSDSGFWHYDVERDGVVRWSSLNTKDERKARAAYERLKANLDNYLKARTDDRCKTQ